MFILVNLKAYDCDPVEIASAAVRVSEQHSDASIALAPQTPDLAATVDTGIETWAQHVDANPTGSHTGSVLAERIAAVGARGTLLNHSERRLRVADIDDGIDRATAAGLKTVVCANNPDQAAAVAELGPDAVAVEPPELIGSGTPVSQADPDVVRDAVQAVEAVNSDIELHCGAGISTGEDVAAAAELGAEGVLVASGVALADDPESALASLARAV